MSVRYFKTLFKTACALLPVSVLTVSFSTSTASCNCAGVSPVFMAAPEVRSKLRVYVADACQRTYGCQFALLPGKYVACKNVVKQMLAQEGVNDWRKFVGYNAAADGGLDFGAFGKTVEGSSGVASGPISSLMPAALRSCTRLFSVLSAFKLRGKPV